MDKKQLSLLFGLTCAIVLTYRRFVRNRPDHFPPGYDALIEEMTIDIDQRSPGNVADMKNEDVPLEIPLLKDLLVGMGLGTIAGLLAGFTTVSWLASRRTDTTEEVIEGS